MSDVITFPAFGKNYQVSQIHVSKKFSQKFLRLLLCNYKCINKFSYGRKPGDLWLIVLYTMPVKQAVSYNQIISRNQSIYNTLFSYQINSKDYSSSDLMRRVLTHLVVSETTE